MRVISIDNIILFHEKLIRETGGSSGIRDLGLIESALNRALITYDGEDLYPSIMEKIAVITHSLISNHGFLDGNKRIGIAVMVFLLKMNNFALKWTQGELIELGLKTAEGYMKEKEVLSWLNEHIRD